MSKLFHFIDTATLEYFERLQLVKYQILNSAVTLTQNLPIEVFITVSFLYTIYSSLKFVSSLTSTITSRVDLGRRSI